jgi:PilZ domain
VIAWHIDRGALTVLLFGTLSQNPGYHAESVPTLIIWSRTAGRMQGYSFFAHAELTVENSDVHLAARMCELSREGCRLEVKNPPLVGTAVLLRIYAWPYYLEVQGKVCDSDPHLSVAVAFGQIESRYVPELNACLLEAEQKQRNPPGIS